MGWTEEAGVVSYRFSAFWLRSKCSICSYQLNIWYEDHVFSSILNWFLKGDRVQELAPALSRVGLTLQYRQDRPTTPLITDISLQSQQPCHHSVSPRFLVLDSLPTLSVVIIIWWETLLSDLVKRPISLSTAISCWKHQFSSDHWS